MFGVQRPTINDWERMLASLRADNAKCICSDSVRLSGLKHLAGCPYSERKLREYRFQTGRATDADIIHQTVEDLTPRVRFNGTSTGRFSSTQQNLVNVPRSEHEEERALINKTVGDLTPEDVRAKQLMSVKRDMSWEEFEKEYGWR